MRKSDICRLGCCLLITFLAFGQTKKITLTDGSILEGTVTETDGNYRIKMKFGSEKIVPKDRVKSIEDVITPEQEYRNRLSKIDPKKATDRFALAEWAYGKGLLQAAREQLEAALKLKPDYEMASLLLREVEAKIQKEGRRIPTKAPPAHELTKAIDGKFDIKWLPTAEEIYRIRLAEIRSTDRVRVKFRKDKDGRDVVDRFITMMEGRGDFTRPNFINEFRAMPPAAKARYILDNTDREDYGIRDDILVKSDPAFMSDFRRRVQPIIRTYCASAKCHGGAKAPGKLRLFRVQGKSQEFDYLNFLILDNYNVNGRSLIDRDHHEDSLLLQFGLRDELAKYKHPMRIKAPFASRRSRQYQQVLEWIRSLKGPPHPFYDVQLRVPWAPKRRLVGVELDEPAPPQPATPKPAKE